MLLPIKSVPMARSCASVEESQVAPLTSTNDIVTEGTGEGRAIQSLLNLCTSEKVTDAQILWGLKCVNSHFSGNSIAGVNDLFKRMFSNSEIVANYSPSKSKFRYVTTFGLGPHFARKLLYDVKQSPARAVLFDESLNEGMQSKQLEVHVHHWSNENCRVESWYLTSMFICPGRKEGLLNHYEEATKDLDPAKDLEHWYGLPKCKSRI